MRRTEEDHSGARPFLELLEKRAPRPLSIQEMARLLGAEHYDRRSLKSALERCVAERTLRRIGKTRYQWIRDFERVARSGETTSAGAAVRGTGVRGKGRSPHATVTGRYVRVRAGYGFVEVLGRAADRFPRDVLVPAGMEGGALHGDRVSVGIVRRDPRLRRVVGEVVGVVEAVHATIIGTLARDGRGWSIVPENDLLPAVEILGSARPQPGQEGMVARVRLTRPPTARRLPGGELEEVLGAADDPEVQFLTVAAEHGVRIEFPAAVVAESDRLPSDPDESEFAGREDLRALPFVTIDGETARDFDDAVCLQTSGGAGPVLWVAIADVSRYVVPGSALDAEAALRGNSVYFPDRAVPMLPPRLSTELCSLNPGRNRLVLVAELRYDGGGRRVDARFCRAVIRSRARLTYTQVAGLLSHADSAEIRAWRTEFEALLPQLRAMHDLMRVLYRNRVETGSLDLDLPEALVDLSEEGRSVGVRLLQRNDAHRLIEEFMLEANRAVALHLRERRLPFPYRIHEPPDPLDVDDLNDFLGPFGFQVDYEGQVRPADVQRLLARLEGHALARVLARQVLRSLKQAQYSTANAGHFGLAFPVYCHFTSPIRRYPDLLVHRQLGCLFDAGVEAAQDEAESIEAASVHSSQTERSAMEAERAMLDLKKAEFMLAHLLEPETGTIVSVTNFGFFVELDAYPVEGLVRADSLEDDRYEFIETERALKGLRTRRRFRLGDRVRVEAVNVSLRRRQIDFALIERLSSAADVAPRAEEAGRRRRRVAGREGKKQAARGRGQARAATRKPRR